LQTEGHGGSLECSSINPHMEINSRVEDVQLLADPNMGEVSIWFFFLQFRKSKSMPKVFILMKKILVIAKRMLIYVVLHIWLSYRYIL